MFLHLPYFYVKGPCASEVFWKELSRQNKCSANLCKKLLSVLFTRKQHRETFIKSIQEHNNLWNNKSILDVDKVVQFLNDNHPTLIIAANKLHLQIFKLIPTTTILNSKFLMWVDI